MYFNVSELHKQLSITRLLRVLSALTVFFLTVGCSQHQIETQPQPEPRPEPQPQPESGLPYVYFVGNSITYNGDIPGKFHSLMTQAGAYPEGRNSYLQNTVGAASLSGYLNLASYGQDHAAIDIFIRKPDYIVLQEQSAGPVVHGSSGLIEYYLSMAEAVGAKVVLYQYWNGQNQEYRDIAVDKNLTMVPIGDIWDAVRRLDGAPVLAADHVHANNLGAAVNAAAFFYVFAPDSPKIDNILGRVGISLSGTQGTVLSDLIYNTVRNDAQAVLRPVLNLKTTADDVGDTPETAHVLEPGNQVLNIDLGAWDVDFFAFPELEAGKKYRLEIQKAGNNSQFYSFYNHLASYALFDLGSQSVPYTPIRVGNDWGYALEFAPRSGQTAYLGIIGNRLVFRLYDEFPHQCNRG